VVLAEVIIEAGLALIAKLGLICSMAPIPAVRHKRSNCESPEVLTGTQHFDPAGTWAWRSGPVDAAAVRQGAVLALLPAEVVVQLRAEAAALELPRRAEAVVAELPRRAEAVVAELPRRAEAAVLELLRRAEAAYARRCLEACSQEALKRCGTAADWWRCYRWLDRRR
jgi:hypothetical protein